MTNVDLTHEWSEGTLGRDDVRDYVKRHAESGGYVPGDQELSEDTIDHITHTLYGLYTAAQEGDTLGGYQEGLVTNDLNKAVSHADKQNLQGIKIAVIFLYNVAPKGEWDDLRDRAEKS